MLDNQRVGGLLLQKVSLSMFKKSSIFLSLLSVAFIVAGCAGPEEKLGRGIDNVTEFGRLGEIRRSMEQTAIFGAPDEVMTTGFFHGFNRSLERTGVGAYEILTFPLPNHPAGDYGPIMHPADPVYPESYKPNWMADTTFSADTSLGFSGGDIAPFIPGSRFRIFDN
ncbi:MAG TPA: exosortase system-associated protein, TIGR04073 family [Verrucomicrobiae bacterium]|nr:exosortase system-associated protein, TIGR04073 family [Verrucomicrobiae bacterium]